MIEGIRSFFSSTQTVDKEQAHHYLVIPDLHGIHSIYKKVETYIKDYCEVHRTIIFLGDYMDRGEAGEIDGISFKDSGSYLIMRDLIALKEWAQKEGRKVIFLRGNHEIFYEDYFLHNKPYAKDEYGFFVTLWPVWNMSLKKILPLRSRLLTS